MTTANRSEAIDQLWDLDHPAESETRFLELLGQVHEDQAYQAELLTQIARTQGLRRNFEAAHQRLDEAQVLLAEDSGRVRIRYLLERGRTLNSEGRRDEARPLFWDAWNLGLAAGEDFYAVDAAHMLAIAETSEEVLAWNFKALELAENSTDPRARKWCGSLHNNIGWSYHGRADYEVALKHFQKALGYRQEDRAVGNIRIATWCIARTLRSLGRVDEALAMQQQLLAEAEEAVDETGYVDEELGECLLRLDRPEEARPHFALAYQKLSQDPWLVAEEPDRLARLKTLGQDPKQG